MDNKGFENSKKNLYPPNDGNPEAELIAQIRHDSPDMRLKDVRIFAKEILEISKLED